jgi:hypothetical protein
VTTDTLVELDEDRGVSLLGVGSPEHRRYGVTQLADGTIILRPEYAGIGVDSAPGQLTVTVHQFERNFEVMLERVERGGTVVLTDDNGQPTVLVIPWGIYEALRAAGLHEGFAGS